MAIRARNYFSGFEEGGLHIFRTDQEGAVQVRTDGHNLNVSCLWLARNPQPNQAARRRQIITRTSRSRKKPTAARYSRFFSYCANENEI